MIQNLVDEYKSFGLIEANNHEFENKFFTTLVYEDREESIKGCRPSCAHGVFGLVLAEDDMYHLMSEDDGYYWTHSRITVV